MITDFNNNSRDYARANGLQLWNQEYQYEKHDMIVTIKGGLVLKREHIDKAGPMNANGCYKCFGCRPGRDSCQPSKRETGQKITKISIENERLTLHPVNNHTDEELERLKRDYIPLAKRVLGQYVEVYNQLPPTVMAQHGEDFVSTDNVESKNRKLILDKARFFLLIGLVENIHSLLGNGMMKTEKNPFPCPFGETVEA